MARLLSMIRVRMKYTALFAALLSLLLGAGPLSAQETAEEPSEAPALESDRPAAGPGEFRDLSNQLRRLDVSIPDDNVWYGLELDANDAIDGQVLAISTSHLFGAGVLGYGRDFEQPPLIARLVGEGAEATRLPLVARRISGGWVTDLSSAQGEGIRIGIGVPRGTGQITAALARPDVLAGREAVEARLRAVLFGAALMLMAFLFAQGLLARRGLYVSGFFVALGLALVISTNAGWHRPFNAAAEGLLDGSKGAALMVFLAFGLDFARRAMKLKDLSPVPNRIGRALILIALAFAAGAIALPELTAATGPLAVIAVLAAGVVVVEGTRQNVDGPKLILGPWLLFAIAAAAATGLALFAPPRFGAGGALLIQGLMTTGALAAALLLGRRTVAPPAAQGLEPAREPAPVRGPDLRVAQAVSGARKGVWDWKIHGDRLYLSSGAMALLGFNSQGGEGKEEAFYARIHGDDQETYRERLRTEVERGHGHFSHDMRVMEEGGDYRWLRLEAEVTGGTTRTGARIVGLLSDVSADHGRGRPGAGDGLHDPLTGLASRALFMDRVEQAEAREDGEASVAVMDVDRFQSIIDGVGHSGGDTMLIVLARRLEGALPKGAFPARLGADQFGILLDDGREHRKFLDLCETVRDIMTEPLEIEGEEIFPALSIGIAHKGPSAEGEPPLLRRAEMAMYHGKRAGGGRIEIYRAEFAKRKGDLMSLETGLNRALERREVELLYQPIMSVAEGRLAGFEALMRWNHPERGQLPPDEFIELAEETGAIVPLGRYVVEAAATQLVAWQSVYKRKSPIFVGVNLSARQILHHDLARDVDKILKQTRPQRRSLVVEVTESVVMENPDLAERRLSALAGEGLGLALDDFGTGYSSLSHLARFAFDKLKIDREFVEALEGDEKTRTIVAAIVGLATDLGQNVIAEGVQSEEQLRLLKSLGCGYAQGFLFGKPMTAAEAERLIINDAKAHKVIGEDADEDDDQARPASPES